MSLSRIKVWISGEILYAADLNTEIDNILSNGSALLSPITSNIDMDGNSIIMDAAGSSSIRAGTTNLFEILLASASLFRFDGTVTTPVNGLDFVAGAAGSDVEIEARGGDANISINLISKGSGSVKVNGTAIGGLYALLAGATFTGEVILPAAGPTSVYSAGYRGRPYTTKDESATFALADAGTCWVHDGGSGHTWTIPPNSSVAFPIGTQIGVRNRSVTLTLARGSGVTLRQPSSGNSADLSLTQFAFGTIEKEASDSWVFQGTL